MPVALVVETPTQSLVRELYVFMDGGANIGSKPAAVPPGPVNWMPYPGTGLEAVEGTFLPGLLIVWVVLVGTDKNRHAFREGRYRSTVAFPVIVLPVISPSHAVLVAVDLKVKLSLVISTIPVPE